MSDIMGDLAPDGRAERVLLVQPPVYDVRFPWSQWHAPVTLLRLGSYHQRAGAQVKLLDGLTGGVRVERLARSRHAIWPRGDMKLNYWRYGLPTARLRETLTAWVAADWTPDIVYVEGFTTYWWQGVQEVTRLIHDAFPQTQIILIGAYPQAAPAHAQTWSGADLVVSGRVTAVAGEPQVFDLFPTAPTFAYLSFGQGQRSPDEVYAEAQAWATHKDPQRRILRFALLDDVTLGTPLTGSTTTLTPKSPGHIEPPELPVPGRTTRRPERAVRSRQSESPKKRQGTQATQAHQEMPAPAVYPAEAYLRDLRALLRLLAQAPFKFTLTVLGTLSAETLVADPELCTLLAQAHCTALTLADDRAVSATTAARDHWIDDVDRAMRQCVAAGFAFREDQLAVQVSLGRPGEDLEVITTHLTRLAHVAGSPMVVPYQPAPGEVAEAGLTLPLEEQNGKCFPFAEANGLTYRSYQDVVGLAALLNAKYRSKTFDFLGDSLVAQLARSSLSSGRWDPRVAEEPERPITLGWFDREGTWVRSSATKKSS